jgi:hypothetical protein
LITTVEDESKLVAYQCLITIGHINLNSLNIDYMNSAIVRKCGIF